MAMTAGDIITRVREATLDTTSGGVRWLDAELIRHINDASQAIVLLKPSAHSINTTMKLDSGTLQEAPSDAILILDVVRNVDGKAIRYVERGVLDASHPDWHDASTSREARHYMMEQNDPTHFYVYPPNNGSGEVRIVYSAAPAKVGDADDDLPLPDTYVNSYVDYVLYRAYSKDADFAANRDLATWYYKSFTQGLGVRTQVETEAPSRKDPYTPAQNPRV